MTKYIEKRWDKLSSTYQKDSKIGTRSAHYGPYAPDENKLNLLGNVKGKKILEMGCGGGQCSIAFAKQGARCTALDISSEQLKYAEELAKKENVSIEFLKKDIQTLKGIKSSNYDIVFSSYSLQFIFDLTKCFKEVHRVLKKGGIFVFSFEHPFFSSLSPETFKINKNYNKAEKIEETETWPDGSKTKFIAYRRKISHIFHSIQETNLVLENIIEPLQKRKDWKEGRWKNIYPQKLIEKIGPTIIFKTKKK